MSAPVQPNSIQKIGTELAIAWMDGEESYLDLEVMRRACPCAVCQGEPDARGIVKKPTNDYSPTSFDLIGWQIVGGYGLQPRWGDGHNTGIYSFAYLRQLGKNSN